MDDYYRPCNFTNIPGYPHDLLDDSTMNKLPIFQGNIAINVEVHKKKFNTFVQRYAHAAAYNCEDVRMRLFVLSLEDNALDQFHEKADIAFGSLRALADAFKDRFGDKREGKYLVEELNTIKKRENEIVEEFKTVRDTHIDFNE